MSIQLGRDNQTQEISQSQASGWGWLVGAIVISATIVGYFTGLQAPMRRGSHAYPLTSKALNIRPVFEGASSEGASSEGASSEGASDEGSSSIAIDQQGVVPATAYALMAKLMKARTAGQRSSLRDLKPAVVSVPASETEYLSSSNPITAADKSFALAARALNRAFNGAPPTIPHPVDQVSTQSCMACHGEGFSTSTLRASKMSHQFLENCTQCHIEQNPQHMEAREFRGTSFVGLPAPREGPRAYPGAPPQVPHTTWMRVDCLSCHGPQGAFGIRTTHPWRDNCLQCHAPSSELDQVKLNPAPAFLKPLKIEN
jgi:cytochrome c-type protein NapB